ncbi:MAG: hypothetical protein HUK05_02265, partial [Prevotella sp.]|nr:hypothetical protein [Prevotella sp.]
AVTMLIEASLSAPDDKEDILRNAKNACISHLNKYMQPRHYIAVDALPLTETGKPARKKAEEMAKG